MTLLQIVTAVLVVMTTTSAQDRCYFTSEQVACLLKVLPDNYKSLSVRQKCCMVSGFQECFKDLQSPACKTFLSGISDTMVQGTVAEVCSGYKTLSKACGMSGGSIAIISVAAVVGVVVIGGFVFCCVRRRSR